MALPDDDLTSSQALVVDSNPTSRSILVSQLRDFGVGTIVQCARLADARRQLEYRPFDVVLCEHHFANDPSSGQDLLDDLRRNQLLPFSTVFIMVTAEATYAKVAEAAESALDGYVLKPHTATSLAERLRQARIRKISLQEIFAAIDAEDFERAAELCLVRFKTRGLFWLYAARVGAELLLRWNSSEVGSVEPARFIPLAEESGLIVGIGKWVLEEACRQQRAWLDAGFDVPPLAVNLSAHQLAQPDIVATVAAAIECHRLAPGLAVNNGLKPEWISRDAAVVAAYLADPLVHERITPRLARFILDGGELVRHLAPLWRVPTLLLWAGADRCVAPRGSAAFAQAAPAGMVQAQVFPALYHEIFNEPERAQVLEQLLAWLAQRG